MRITKNDLRQMIIEEMRNFKAQRLQEGTVDRPVKVTPELLNRIIREEYAAYQRRQRLDESRRRRSRR